MINLYEEYGYVTVPKGTLLFREGKLEYEYGGFFALCEHWAMSFEIDEDYYAPKKQNIAKKIYEVNEDLKLLFLISRIDQSGFPITAIDLLYQVLTKEDKLRDDLDIKWRKIELRKIFNAALLKEKALGWLSTIENHEPLEIFILPNAMDKIQLREDLVIENYKHYNALSAMEIYPSPKFTILSLENIKSSTDFILSRKKRTKDVFYSIVDKLFIESNLIKQLPKGNHP